MGWIDATKQLPPEGLTVLLEVSGHFAAPYGLIADHDFYIGCWLVPQGQTEGKWLLTDGHEDEDYHLYSPTVHAWMPLPKHFQPAEKFDREEDMMEHAMFEDDPEWLYTGEYVYEQQTLEDYFAANGNIMPCPYKKSCQTYGVGCNGQSFWCNHEGGIGGAER